MHFLLRATNSWARSIPGTIPNKTYVADYIFEKDKLFACLNLGDVELEVYNRYYELFRQNVPTPDLVIYLQATPEVSEKAAEEKGRAR